MSVSDDNGRRSSERFLELLDAYGADPRRWPEHEREAHARALSEQAYARAVNEARALDALLDRASAPAADVQAASRLLARATPEARAGNILDLAAASRRKPPRPRVSVAALSTLAASLLLGLYLGASGLTEDFVPGEAEAEAQEAAQLADLDVLSGAVGFLTEQEDT